MSVAFLLTSLAIVALPGPGALYTVAAGLSRGARGSVVAAAGCTLGIVPHLAAAITGAAALLHASGVAFQTVKLLGVAYLLYLAWTTWRDTGTLALDADPTPVRARRVIGTAVSLNLLNPKLTVFFFAFLPQFVPAGTPHAFVPLLGLSAVFMAMTFLVFVAYGVFAAAFRSALIERPCVVDRMRKLFAVSFVALSARLATTSR